MSKPPLTPDLYRGENEAAQLAEMKEFLQWKAQRQQWKNNLPPMPTGVTIKASPDPERPAVSFHLEGSTAGAVIFRGANAEDLIRKLISAYAHSLLKISQLNRALKEKYENPVT